MRFVRCENGLTGAVLLAFLCSCAYAWVPVAPLLLASGLTSIATAVTLQATSNSGGQDETAETKGLVDLETELDLLQRNLEVQKGTYEEQLRVMEEKSQSKVQEAQKSLASLMIEYEAYKKEMLAKLGAAPSAQEVARMQSDLAELQERTSSQESQLASLKQQLFENRQARQGLQAEMVALREGYANRLGELEDALELEQNERLKLQQDMPQIIEKMQREFRQRLKDTVEESKLHADQMTANFTSQLEQRDQLLADAESQLKQAEAALEEQKLTLSVLEGERQSLRKLIGATLRLLRQRLSKRFSRKPKQQDDDKV